MFSCAFFQWFFLGINSLRSLVFTLSLFSVLFLEGLGGLLLSPYVDAQYMCVGLFIHGFSGFSVCPLCNLHSTTCRWACFQLPSMSAPPSSGDSVAILTVAWGALNSLSNEIAVTVAHALQQSFIGAFCVENLTALPPVFSIVSGLATVATSSFSSSAGTSRLLPYSLPLPPPPTLAQHAWLSQLQL